MKNQKHRLLSADICDFKLIVKRISKKWYFNQNFHFNLFAIFVNCIISTLHIMDYTSVDNLNKFE